MGSSGASKVSRVIAEAHADAGPVNTTSETDLASLALPTTLAAGDIARFVAVGDQLNNSAGAVTYTDKLYIGTTNVIATSAMSQAQTANRRRWVFSADILIVDPAATQLVGSSLTVSATAAVAQMPMGSSGVFAGSGFGTVAEDLTAAKNVRLTATLGTADANADCICHFAALVVIKK